jgi:hypothetical protein
MNNTMRELTADELQCIGGGLVGSSNPPPYWAIHSSNGIASAPYTPCSGQLPMPGMLQA